MRVPPRIIHATEVQTKMKTKAASRRTMCHASFEMCVNFGKQVHVPSCEIDEVRVSGWHQAGSVFQPTRLCVTGDTHLYLSC